MTKKLKIPNRNNNNNNNNNSHHAIRISCNSAFSEHAEKTEFAELAEFVQTDFLVQNEHCPKM
jgi:hypothetical protein